MTPEMSSQDAVGQGLSILPRGLAGIQPPDGSNHRPRSHFGILFRSRPGGARDYVPATSDRVRSVAYSHPNRGYAAASSRSANLASSLGHFFLSSRRAPGASVRCPLGVSFGRGQALSGLVAPVFLARTGA